MIRAGSVAAFRAYARRRRTGQPRGPAALSGNPAGRAIDGPQTIAWRTDQVAIGCLPNFRAFSLGLPVVVDRIEIDPATVIYSDSNEATAEWPRQGPFLVRPRHAFGQICPRRRHSRPLPPRAARSAVCFSEAPRDANLVTLFASPYSTGPTLDDSAPFFRL